MNLRVLILVLTFATTSVALASEKSKPKSTGIWHAFEFSPEEVARWLDAGRSIDATLPYGQKLIHEAAEHENPAFLQLLLARKANVESTDEQGRTPIMRAAHAERAENVKQLLEARANFEAQGWAHGKVSALHCSVNDWTGAVAKLLLQARATVDPLDGDGSTPLIWACDRRNIEVAKLLVAARANTNIKNNYGQMPGVHGDKAFEALLQIPSAAASAPASTPASAPFAPMEENKAVVKNLTVPVAARSRTAPAHAGSGWRCALPCCCCRNCAKKDKDT